MRRKELQPTAKARLEDGAWAERTRSGRRRIKRFERVFGSIVKVVEDRKENRFLALEVKVERAARDASALDDVRNTCATVAAARKHKGGCGKQLLSSGFCRQQLTTASIFD